MKYECHRELGHKGLHTSLQTFPSRTTSDTFTEKIRENIEENNSVVLAAGRG